MNIAGSPGIASSKLGSRVFLYLLILCTFFIVAGTAAQLFNEHDENIRELNRQFESIKHGQLAAITESVWATNDKEIALQLQSIASRPFIEYVAIHDGNTISVETGRHPGGDSIERSYPLSYQQLGKTYSLGSLQVVANKSAIWDRLYNNASYYAITTTISMILISLFVFFLFDRTVTRHIVEIENYVHNINPFDNAPPLVLQRKNDGSNDEIDSLVNAINQMHAVSHNLMNDLKVSEQQFRAIADYTYDWECWHQPDGKVKWVNPAVEKVTGYSVDECLRMTCFPLPIISNDYRKHVRKLYKNAFETRSEGTDYILKINRKDKSTGWVEASWQPIFSIEGDYLGIRSSFRDISERYEAEKIIQAQRKEQDLILNNMVDAIITIDEQGTILTFNPAAERMFGYTTVVAKGQNIKMLMPEEYNDFHNESLKNYSGSDNTDELLTKPLEVSGKRKNGQLFPMRISVAELPKTSGGKRRFIGTCQDVTIQLQQDEQLRRSQKMDAIGKLTGGIAHDFNNMLGVILGYAELLCSLIPEDRSEARYVREIHHAGERAKKLTAKLLDFSRVKATAAEQTNISEILKNEQHMLQQTLTARINLHMSFVDDLWPAFLDKAGLEDTILNMSINAMHAMPEGGTLSIEAGNIHLSRFEAYLLKLQPGDYIRLKLSDTGIGMDQDTQANIFDPFYTTKGDNGTGLGLSQVYGFVQQSNGAIEVTSAPGKGTGFTLYFPRHIEDCLVEDETQAEIQPESQAGHVSVLVVDDEPSLLSLGKEILTSSGYHVLTANNGHAALEILEQEHIDVVLSDIIMPEIDGYELASIIQERYPHIAVQLASGYSDESKFERIDEELQKSRIQKPYKINELLTRIREIIPA